MLPCIGRAGLDVKNRPSDCIVLAKEISNTVNRTGDSFSFAIILNLLLPGLGHFFWKERTFGLFIFLVMLTASALFFVTFLISMPKTAKIMLLGMPVLFFLFTFFDLVRTVKSKKRRIRHSTNAAVIFLLLGVFHQLLAPNTPSNFLIRNFPEIYRLSENHLAPQFKKGDLLVANRLAYSADIFFFDFPVYHALPDRFEVVRFVTRDNRRHTGLLIGLPGEYIEVIDGAVVADGYPKYSRLPTGFSLGLDRPLTVVDNDYILVVTLNLGTVDSVYHIPLTSLVGKVERIF